LTAAAMPYRFPAAADRGSTPDPFELQSAIPQSRQGFPMARFSNVGFPLRFLDFRRGAGRGAQP